MKNWIFTDHVELQIFERLISRDVIEAALTKPDEIVQRKRGRLVYRQAVGKGLAKVVVGGKKVITFYITSKVKKYLGQSKR